MAKPIWKRPNPKQQRTPLTADEKKAARRAAKQHGRSTPSLVDNINAQKKTTKQKKTKVKKAR
jgi:hypothetical protein